MRKTMKTHGKREVLVDTSEYLNTHGKEPGRGTYGFWVFENSAGAATHFCGTYRKALSEALAQADINAADRITLLVYT